ncbi:MAG: hypothetical protein ACKPKO_45130, partial [Candidatus Fonsibacter sp.]
MAFLVIVLVAGAPLAFLVVAGAPLALLVRPDHSLQTGHHADSARPVSIGYFVVVYLPYIVIPLDECQQVV